MTAKDYKLITETLNKVWKSYEDDWYPEQEAVKKVVHSLSDALLKDNPRFVSPRFIFECLKDGGL